MNVIVTKKIARKRFLVHRYAEIYWLGRCRCGQFVYWPDKYTLRANVLERDRIHPRMVDHVCYDYQQPKEVQIDFSMFKESHV